MSVTFSEGTPPTLSSKLLVCAHLVTLAAVCGWMCVGGWVSVLVYADRNICYMCIRSPGLSVYKCRDAVHTPVRQRVMTSRKH